MTDLITLLTTTFAAVRDHDLDLFDIYKVADGDYGAVAEWAKSRRIPVAKLDRAAKDWRTHQQLGTRARTPQQFAEAVISNLGVRISFDGLIIRAEAGIGAEYTLANLIDDVISKCYEMEAGFRESALKIEVSRWVQRSKDEVVRTIHARITNADAPRCNDEWQALAGALLMPGTASLDYAVAVLQTLVWQVKRKMAGLPVTGHLMPILTGGQGNGKTSFIQQFVSPVADLTTFVSFKEALDSRNLGVWSSYIHVYDEMEHAERTDINAVKSAITGEKRTARIMASNHTASVRQCATSIGATNSTVGAVMRDPTGMRRYAPFPTSHKPGSGRRGEVNWDVINHTDYVGLWQSVQVDDPRPADRVAAELGLLQDGERTPDPVEYWLRHAFDPKECTQTKSLRDTDAIASTDLHRHFTGMMADHFKGHTVVNVQSFGARLTGFLGEPWCPFSCKEEAKSANFYHLKKRPAEADARTGWAAPIDLTARITLRQARR